MTVATPWMVRTALGRVDVVPVRPEHDLDPLHPWVTHPRSHFWLMGGATRAEVADAYTAIDEDPHHDAWIGRIDGEPLSLIETYDPAHRELVGHWDAAPGDIGMHLLVAPPGRATVHGLTSLAMAVAVGFAFSRPEAVQVVVEPDEDNLAVRAKNLAAGFVEHGVVDLGVKRAMLSTCARKAFAGSELGGLLT